MKLHAMHKIIDCRCHKIILGSMPGMESLRLQQYYAHPQNQFWRLIYALDQREPEVDYAARLQFILGKSIALWDVLSECEREGSLDSNIQQPVVNDFPRLFTEYPLLKHIYFNGAKAYSLFMKQAAPLLESADCQLTLLPSSSPAHTISFADKWKAWSLLAD